MLFNIVHLSLLPFTLLSTAFMPRNQRISPEMPCPTVAVHLELGADGARKVVYCSNWKKEEARLSSQGFLQVSCSGFAVGRISIGKTTLTKRGLKRGGGLALAAWIENFGLWTKTAARSITLRTIRTQQPRHFIDWEEEVPQDIYLNQQLPVAFRSWTAFY
ncbi:hypothetical protein DFS34DRAFT_172 [Phlyctochytrium arcticum]|nr:hypothetical protein DFS34DRAFT_172 [Phlyctochytrium arcticum]